MSNFNTPSSLPKPGNLGKGANSVHISSIKDFLSSIEGREDFFLSLNYSMSELDLEYFINWLMERSFWSASYKALNYKINYSNNSLSADVPPDPIKKILPLLLQSDFSKEYKRNQTLLLLKNKDWTQTNLVTLIESQKFTIFTPRELIDLSIKNNFVWKLEAITYLLESRHIDNSDKQYFLDFLKQNNFDFKQRNSILLVSATNAENVFLISDLLALGAKTSDRVRQTFLEALYKNNSQMFELYEAALIKEGQFNDDNIDAVINACISSLNHAWLTKVLSGPNAKAYKDCFTSKHKSLSLVLSFQESFHKNEHIPESYDAFKLEIEKLIILLIENNLISVESTHKGLPAIFKNCSDDFRQLINQHFVPYFEKTEPLLISKNIVELLNLNSPNIDYWIEAISSSTQKSEDILKSVLSHKSEENWPSLLLAHLEDFKAACSKKEKIEIENFIPIDDLKSSKVIKI